MRLRAAETLVTPEATEEAGAGRDQEGPPAFKFMRDEAMTNREAP